MAERNGRIPKLTPDSQKTIVDAVTAGVPQKYAAQRAGITPQTLCNWKAKGRKATSGGYYEFLEALKKAEADALARNVAIIMRAASERTDTTVKEFFGPDGALVRRETSSKKVFDWCAAAWWLERQYPEEFGRHAELANELRKLLKEMKEAKGVGSKPPAPEATS